MFAIKTNNSKVGTYLQKAEYPDNSHYNTYHQIFLSHTNSPRRAIKFDTKVDASKFLNHLVKLSESNYNKYPDDPWEKELFDKIQKYSVEDLSTVSIPLIEFSGKSVNPKSMPIKFSDKDCNICSFCKVYIPKDFPYVKLNTYKICGFCIKIMGENFDQKMYEPHEESYRAERLINSL